MELFGIVCTIDALLLMAAFILLPMGMFFIMVFGDMPGDVIDAATLRSVTQSHYNFTIYTIFSVGGTLIVANIYRMILEVYTENEIVRYRTQQVNKQNLDDIRLIRRYARDSKLYHEFVASQQPPEPAKGPVELVETPLQPPKKFEPPAATDIDTTTMCNENEKVSEEAGHKSASKSEFVLTGQNVESETAVDIVSPPAPASNKHVLSINGTSMSMTGDHTDESVKVASSINSEDIQTQKSSK